MQKPRKLDLVSMYMNQRVLGGHGISLSLEETKQGKLTGTAQIDPNSCSLDQWGDRQGCTKIGFMTLDVEATAMRTLDPQGHHRVHWTVQIEGVEDAKIALIEYPRAKLWYLAVDTEQEGTMIVPLFAAELFALARGQAARAG